MQSEITEAKARALLQWYAAMGVDEAVGGAPMSWFERTAAAAPAQDTARGPGRPAAASIAQTTPAPPRAPGPPRATLPAAMITPAPPPERRFAPAPQDETLMAARAQARSATTLDGLREMLAAFDGCALKATAKNLCFYRGARQARLMAIGEAPGREEDLEGRPFVGRAGQLLDRMLGAIGLTEADLHITNVVYWRPPGNRTPTPQEALICQPFLQRQIELVAPEFIVCLGGAAAKQVLGTAEGIMKLRGKWKSLDVAGEAGGRAIQVMATLHPAYLLRTPAAKRLAWRDLLAIRAGLDGATATIADSST